MYFRVVQPSRDAFAFQVVLTDGSIALTSVPFADRAAAMRAIHVVIACLREGIEASLEVDGDGYRCSLRGLDGAIIATGTTLQTPAEVDAQLADLQHWVATVERFRVEEPLQSTASTATYEHALSGPSRGPGLELLEPNPASKAFAARINDERGALLYTPGFPTRFARDEHVEGLLTVLGDPRRYDRREDDGRRYLVVHTKNGRELARSRAFADDGERDAAIAWLVTLPPDRLVDARSQRYNAAGFEGYRGAGGQFFFRLHDEAGQELFVSHGYASAKARDNGIRSLLKAATDPTCYRVSADGTSFTITALNGRNLVTSRAFAGIDDIERAAAWVRREIVRLGKECGIRLWESMVIELPHDIDELSVLDTPSSPEVVDQPFRVMRLDEGGRTSIGFLPTPEPETPSVVIEAPFSDPPPTPDPPHLAAAPDEPTAPRDAAPDEPAPATTPEPDAPEPIQPTRAMMLLIEELLQVPRDSAEPMRILF